MFRCSIRTVLGTALVLGGCARLVAASPQLLFDQTAGDSWVDWDVMTVPGTHYLSVTGPRVGIVRYEPATGWTLLDTPELDEYRTAPFWAAGHVFFSGSPSGGDNRKHLYVVDGDGAVELAVAPESLWSVGLIIEIGGRAVFEFADDTHGTELWASDGSPGGTRLLKDINPTGDSFPDLGVVAGGFLFFSADDGIHGRELWLTDGSSAGTRMVKDILPGPEGSFPYDLEEVNGLVVFRALDELAGLEPHRSDGTEAGTYLVRDLEPGEGWSRPEGFTTIDGWAYFLARTDDLGLEPYRTNGNAVQFIRDINPGYRSCAWFSRGFFGYNGEVYFAADDGVHGDEPWKTDGTSPGTQMVDDCTPGLDDTSPATFVEAGGTLFFRASPASSTGSELWKTLGTTGTTQEVAVNPNGPCFPNLLFGTSSYLYFGATDGTSVGHEPRRLDVATGTIELLEDLNTDDGSNCERLTAYGEDLLAFSDSWQFGRDLWHFDLADPEASFDFDDGGWHESQAPAGARFAVDGALVYFTGWHQDTGFEVGVYDGISIDQIDVIAGTDGCNPTELVVADGKAFFVGTTASGSYGLFRITAPPNPTAILIHDCGATAPHDLTPLGSDVLFVMECDVLGEELWKSNGQQTGPLLDVNPGPDGSDPQSFTTVGTDLFFTAFTAAAGRELWVTNGTANGTHLVEDLIPGPDSSNPAQLTDAYPCLYFTAATPTTGSEIYRATGAGLEALPETVPGPGSANPQDLAHCGSRLRFSADDGSGIGREPWMIVGNTPTLMVDLNPGAASSNPRDFGDHIGATYFTATRAGNGRELWRFAGGLLSEVSEPIAPGPASSQVGDRTTVGTRLYFVAENGAFGREIWSVNDNGGPADVPSAPIPLGSSPNLTFAAGPNPFVDHLTLRLQLPLAGTVRGLLVDAGGRVIDQRDFGHLDAGTQTLEWSLRPEYGVLSSGVCFLRIENNGRAATRKLVCVRRP